MIRFSILTIFTLILTQKKVINIINIKDIRFHKHLNILKNIPIVTKKIKKKIKKMPIENQEEFLEYIQKRSLRNIEYDVYTLIENRFILIPNEYSEGQFYLAKDLLKVDLNKENFEGKIKHYKQYLNSRDKFWYLGKINLCEEIIKLRENLKWEK